MKQGKVAYHSVIVEVREGVNLFTAIDFQFPAHHKVCTGLMVIPTLTMSDIIEGQGIGELNIEFNGETLNFNDAIRYCAYPERHTYCYTFHELNVPLKSNQAAKGHYTNEVEQLINIAKEGEPEKLELRYIKQKLTLIFRCTT